MSLLTRLLHGLIGAAFFGVVGWIASQLTVGVVLSRHFDSAQHFWLTRVWLICCPAVGFLGGILYDRRMVTPNVR
jgi:hypothetical protein